MFLNVRNAFNIFSNAFLVVEARNTFKTIHMLKTIFNSQNCFPKCLNEFLNGF